MEGVILGFDIGSSHIKLTKINLHDLSLECRSYPVLHVARKAGLDRLELIKEILSKLLFEHIKKNNNNLYVNIVTSLEATRPRYNFLEFFTGISRNYKDVNFYTINENLSVQDMESLKSWPYMSSIHSVRYLAGKILENGVLIHMNAASSVFAPVLNGRPVHLPLHYSSGIALWKGALYTLLKNISTTTIVFGKQSSISSPDFVSILDILVDLDKLSHENLEIIRRYTSLIKIDKENLANKLMTAIGCFPDMPYFNPYTNSNYDVANQKKLSSLYLYQKYLFIIFENVIRILSEVDIPWEKVELIVSGIGKDLILKDSLRVFENKVKDIELYIPNPYSTFLESFGSALSLFETLTGMHIDLKNNEFYSYFKNK